MLRLVVEESRREKKVKVLHLRGVHSDSGVVNGNADQITGRFLNFNLDCAIVRIFSGVAEQVGEDLFDALWVRNNFFRDLPIHHHLEADFFLVDLFSEQAKRFVNQLQ